MQAIKIVFNKGKIQNGKGRVKICKEIYIKGIHMTKRETEKQSELERKKWREGERKLDETNGNRKKK